MIHITERREALGMSQAQLARAVGVIPSSVSQWESGTKTPATDKLPALAKALKCKIDDLFKEDNHAED